MSYKWCAVPACTNTTVKTPDKLFVTVPKNVKVRKKWLQLAHRDPNEIKEKSVIFFCQDHFNIKQDMANYYQYSMGLSQKIIMQVGVVPTKFYCQEDHRKRMSDAGTSRAVFVKRQKTQLIQECQDSQLQKVISAAGPSNIQSAASDRQEVVIMATDPGLGPGDEVPEVCRTCLATGVRMYDVAARGLHDTFETVTGTQLLTSEQRPTQVCYVCWSQLQRFRAFCQMSRRADAYMTQLLIERRQITQQEVSKCHRLIKPKLNVKRNPLIALHTQEDPDECAIVEVKVEEDTEEEDKNISDYETESETEIRSEVKTGTYVSDRENEMEESRSDFETEKEIKIEIDEITIEEFDPLEAIKHTNVGDETCYCLQCAEGFPSQSELLKHAQNHAQKKLKQANTPGLNKKVISAKKNVKTKVESQSEFYNKTLEFETQLATRVTRDHGFREVAQNSKRRKPNILRKTKNSDNYFD